VGNGVVPLSTYKAFAQLSDDAAYSYRLPALAGVSLFVAGSYQSQAAKNTAWISAKALLHSSSRTISLEVR
jgi:hypothetical protein